MKKLLALFILAILVVVACEKAEPDNNKNENGKPGNKVENITIPSTVDTTPTVTEGKDTVKVQFTAVASWTASIINTKADNWCTVYPTSGPAGNVEIEIKVQENTTPDERSATINIVSGETTKSITVTQKQKDALTITESSMEVPAEGGEVSIEVKANVSFKHSVDADAASWIKYINTKALKTSNMIFDIKENEDLDSRQGCIYVTDGTLTDTITIYQAGGKPFIVLGKNEVSLEPDGGSFDIEVRHNVDAILEPVFPKGVTPWFDEIESKAASTNKFSFVADENTTYSSRTAMIIALNRDASVADTVYVTQKQNNAIILGNDQYYLSSKGGEFKIKIQSNVRATAEPVFPANVTPWFENAGTKALTDSTYLFIAQENTAIEPRTAHIVFKNTETNITDTVSVTQYQKGLVIGEKAFTIEMQGGNLKVDLAENASVQVKYESNGTGGWIDASVANKQCILNIAQNESYDSRSAFVLLNNADNSIKDTIQITQKQTNAIILGDKECYLKYSGGDFTIRVQSNVTATAKPVFPESVQPWFAASETKALTESTFTFTAEENNSSQPRSAKIVFLNTESSVSDTLTVTQYQKGLILGEKVVNVNAAASNYTINFIENARFSKSFEIEGNNGWIEAQVDGKKGVLNILRNDTYDKRALGLIFSNLDNTITDTLKVYQAQNDTLMIDVNDTLRTLDSREQVITVKVDNNIDLTSSVQCESGDWIHKVETKGLKTTSFDFLIDENTGETQRKGYITFASMDSTIKQTLTLVQNPAYEMEISCADTLYFVWDEAINKGYPKTDIYVSCEVPVSYSTENKWFTVETMESGIENEYVYSVFAYNPNEKLEPNVGQLYFYNDEYNLRDTVTLIRPGKNQFELDVEYEGDDYYTHTLRYSTSEQELRIPIRRNTDFNFTVSSEGDWFKEGDHIIHTLYPYIRNACYDTLVFNIAENTKFERTAVITFEYENSYGGNYEYELNIVQAGSDVQIAVEIKGTEIQTPGISYEDLRRYTNIKVSGSMSSDEFCAFFSPNDKVYWSAKILNLHDLDITDDRIYCNIYAVSSNVSSNATTKVVIDSSTPAFASCFERLEELYLPQSVKELESTAFSVLRSLKVLEFGENSEVEKIQGGQGTNSIGSARLKGAFNNCDELERVVLPASLKELWGGAFSECDKLRELSFEKCTQMSTIMAWAKITNNNTGFWSPSNPEGVVGNLGMFAYIPGITSFVVPECVKIIGPKAFYGSYLTEITIGDHVETIYPGAFEGCNLTKINSSKYSPDGVSIVVGGRLIYVSKELEEYTLPESVTCFADNVFEGVKFRKIVLNDNITELPKAAFTHCTDLEEVVLSKNLKHIPYRCFFYCTKLKNLTIPESVETIGEEAFCYSSLSGDIVLGNNLHSIGEEAFSCTNITSITVPETCTVIGSGFVADCRQLEKVILPSEIDIENSSTNSWFSGSVKLTSVTLPKNIDDIGGSMFSGCTSLTEVTIPSSVKSIQQYAFYGCSSLKQITIPEQVTLIGEVAFKNCTLIESMVIPSSVEHISANAFYGCSALKTITLNEGLKYFDSSCFSGCPIETITIPSTVTYLTSVRPFYMTTIKTVYCKTVVPPELGTGMSDGYYPEYMPVIYVPAEAVEAYKAARNWSSVASKIQGYNF